ncbi:MAG: ATP-binding cassette domain-containing protein [Planctomycetota bacterium]|nr:ATP-binding cassette domain-containing protein [Planctomycetota bacterium]
MIAVDNLSVGAGTFRLDGITFEIPSGRYGVLMGQTGCGKTTILETICGLKSAHGGRIRLMGRDVTQAKPAERNIGFVPQDGALFYTMSVRQNLGFALHMRRWPAEEARRRVDELSELLHITHLLDRAPHGLSGGEKQRVSLGRALAFHPDILCLDEPLSALDDDTREAMIRLLKEVQRKTGVTALHITHNRLEAEKLADNLLSLDQGRLKVLECLKQA